MKNEHTSALCPACGSDCNERDELEKAEREINRLRAAPQQAEPVWVRPDQLQKARQAPFLCRVSPTKDAPDLMPMFLHPPAAEVQRLRDAETKRGLLLWALYHAQGASSQVGQPIRRNLGIGRHERLTPEQIKDAARAAQGDKT